MHDLIKLIVLEYGMENHLNIHDPGVFDEWADGLATAIENRILANHRVDIENREALLNIQRSWNS